MGKKLMVLLIVGLLVLGTTQAVMAFGPGQGQEVGPEGKESSCWVITLPEEIQEKIAEIRENYQEKIASLRDNLRSQKQDKDFEGSLEAREQLAEVKEEVRTEITEVMPEEYQEKAKEMGPGKKCGPGGRMMMKNYGAQGSD